MENEPQNLRQALVFYFSESDIRNICFDLGLDADNFGHEKIDIVREFVTYLQNNHRLIDLILICERERPHVDWDRYYQEHEQNRKINGFNFDSKTGYLFLGFAILLLILVLISASTYIIFGTLALGAVLILLLALLDD